jgi:hypothetical protein
MEELPALGITRGNGMLVVRWAGSPWFKIKVPDTATPKVALMFAAETMEQDARRHTGQAQKEIESCIRQLRRFAATDPPPAVG